MKALITMTIAAIFVLALSACGCSNSATDNTQTPGTTILPDTLPTIGSNIPDPDVDTEMPIYTDGTEDTIDVNPSNPSDSPDTTADK